jgi:hypothetical protein
MHSSTHHKQTSRLGHWLPSNRNGLNAWIANTIEQAEKRQAPLHPVVQEFQDMIESDPVMFMYFTQMFERQPAFSPPPQSGDIKLRNYLMPAGMAEVSSCVVSVKEGQHVRRGDEIDFFQFGGSTHCLVFRRGDWRIRLADNSAGRKRSKLEHR